MTKRDYLPISEAFYDNDETNLKKWVGKLVYLNVLLFAVSYMYMKRVATCRPIATQNLSIYTWGERLWRVLSFQG